jgi:hypothetical protein
MLNYLDTKLVVRQRGEDDLDFVSTNEVEMLAGSRADLMFTQRHIVERIASKKGWAAGISRLHSGAAGKEPVFTETKAVDAPRDRQLLADHTEWDDLRGVIHSSLLNGVSTCAGFSQTFEDMTVLMLKQCVLASRLRLAEGLCADVAVLRYDAGDLTTTLEFLSRALRTFANRGWSVVESHLLGIHLQCLKKLNRTDSYVRLGLSILSNDARCKRSRSSHMDSPYSPSSWAAVEGPNGKEVLADIFDASAKLPRSVTVPLDDFFTDISVDPYIQLLDDRDGFFLKFQLRSLFDNTITAEAIQVTLRCPEVPHRELFLETTFPTDFKSGMNTAELSTYVSSSPSCHFNHVID